MDEQVPRFSLCERKQGDFSGHTEYIRCWLRIPPGGLTQENCQDGEVCKGIAFEGESDGCTAGEEFWTSAPGGFRDPSGEVSFAIRHVACENLVALGRLPTGS